MWQLCAWFVSALTGLVMVSSFCLLPLVGNLQLLFTWSGWEQLYGGFTYSNLDVLALSLFKLVLEGSLVLLAPTTDIRHVPNHDRVCLNIKIVAWLFQIFLVVKVAAAAVLSPDDVMPSYGSKESPQFVGLLYMFGSLCSALLFSMLDSSLARRAVRSRETKFAAARSDALDVEESLGVTAPLLAEEGAEKSGGGLKNNQNKKEKNRTIRELMRLCFIDWPIITVAFSAGVAAALAQAFIPHLTGQIIDYASIDPDKTKFASTCGKLVLMALTCAIFSGVRGGLFSLAITRLNVRIRTMLFKALLAMEIGFFDTTKSGDITSRLNADTSTVSTQVCLNMNVMLRSATQASMVMAFMFFASWRLTVITIILVPIILTISKVYGRYMASLSKKVQSELAEANATAQEVLASMTTVKAHGAQDSAEAMYCERLRVFYNLNVKEAIVYSFYACITTFLPNLVSAIVLYYGGYMVLDGTMSPGALVSFMLYQQSLSGAFSLMGDVFSSLTAAVGAADKVMELMHRKPEVDAGGSLILHEGLRGSVELKDVCFHYPARPDMRVLKGLSLNVKAGEVVALVGASGGGKSSIVNLVQRFYLPQAGSVLIDGRDVGVYDAKWLRRQVALVSQEPVLYARSIRRNIIYGLEDEDGSLCAPNQEDVEDAAKQANAHDFIMSFPDKYETNCGEKGVQMSGGQKQRIAIARALVRKPRVLLLDEATSALDADSEAVVQEALDRIMTNRTTLVIAHRLSTIQGADRIIVIGNGVIQESGTHEELLGAGGSYAALVRRQLTKAHSSATSLQSMQGR